MKKVGYKVLIIIVMWIIWTGLVFTNNISWFDDSIYSFLYSLQSDSLTGIMKAITYFSNVSFMIVIGCFTLILLFWKRKEPFYILGTLISSTILNLILKNIIRKDRPLHVRLIEESGFSYPSGHAMASISFYGSIIVLVKNSKLKYKWLIIGFLNLLIFLIGVSRIYLGVHYPSDIISGWLIVLVLLVILDEIVRRKNESINNRSK